MLASSRISCRVQKALWTRLQHHTYELFVGVRHSVPDEGQLLLMVMMLKARCVKGEVRERRGT
jgi:hypothetical protein